MGQPSVGVAGSGWSRRKAAEAPADLMWAPAPSRRAGALGGRHRCRGSADTVDFAPPERHDSHCAQDETYHTASQAPFRRTTWQQKLNYMHCKGYQGEKTRFKSAT